MEVFDVAIAGGGPAGSTCAAFCASAGLRTLLLERERFPREKVCGDCVNPACWPVLERLNLRQRVQLLPHAILEAVDFIAIDGQSVHVDLPSVETSEIAVKRSAIDNLLLALPSVLGARVRPTPIVRAVR